MGGSGGLGRLGRGRRRLLAGCAALALAGAAGARAILQADRSPLAPPPRGWLLASRAGPSDGERELVAVDIETLAERPLDRGAGVRYLAAALSPDARTLALLSRVPRGSMPTDAVATFDARTLRRLAEVEVQIPFQRAPTYDLSWSADGGRLAVPYRDAGRTLLFGVAAGGEVSLRAAVGHAPFAFHPTRPDVAIYETTPPAPPAATVVRIAPDGSEQVEATLAGSGAAWSPDGARLAYLAAGALAIRDERTGAEARRSPGRVQALAWSPDGQRLAAFADPAGAPLAGMLPAGLLPAWALPPPAPGLLVCDADGGGALGLGGLPAGLRLARLEWLAPDWLALVAASAQMSRVVDRRGERRLPLPGLTDFTPYLGWLPA